MFIAQLTIEQSLPYIWVGAGILSLIFGSLYMFTRKRWFFGLEVLIFLIIGLYIYSPEGSDYRGVDLNTTLLIGLTALGGFVVGFFGVYIYKMATGNLKEDEKLNKSKFKNPLNKKDHN
jgi:hypothetical protein